MAASLTVLLLLFGATAALAADSSSPTHYNDDNYSEGFNAIYPHDCWRSFDMSYYGGFVWEAFVKGTGPAGDEIAVFVAKNDPGKPPSSKPTHYRVVERDQTWESSWEGDGRKPNLVRFATFKDKLFLYIAKTYDDDTGSMLWQKQIDPIADENVDGTRWDPPGTPVCSNRPGSKTTSPRVIRGLVVKVMNDTLYILLQYGGTRDLYLITSTNAVDFSTPQKIHTFAGNDCLLNGDVIARGSDGAPLLAFLTKDDADGGKTSKGTIKLWTFDPAAATNAVSAVAATLPGHDTAAGAYRDATLVAGDVAGCTPYGATNLQIWGIGWGSSNVYHMQYVFGSDGKSGAFNPTGIRDHGDASVHVEQSNRGYLASCMAPEPTEDSSLQQYARVWWWGSTDIGNAHGRSLKYPMDYLKRLEPTQVDTSTLEYSPAWVLQGVIYGLPPYYPNGTEIGKLAGSFQVAFGLEYSQAVSNSVTSEKTLSISYKKKGILGIPSASMGLGWSNAVQQTSSSTQKVTQGSTLTWSPDTKGSPPPEDGAQAWGVFFAPTITNDRYHVYGPDKTTDLDVELYYTYISSGSDLIDKVFDKTDPESLDLGQPTRDYWTGTTPWPNSKTYWDPVWTSGQTLISPTGTDTYENIRPAKFWTAMSGSAAVHRYIATENTTEQSRTCTNKIDVSGGAFGFSTTMSGSLSIASATATTFGTKLDVIYGLPGWDDSLIDPSNSPPHYNDYLKRMDVFMYLLRAKSQDAFWIPDGATRNGIQNYPWCITWHVGYWESQGATDEHGKYGPSVATMVGNTQTDVARTMSLPHGLRSALLAKLKATKAAYDRGDKVAAANTLGALINQVEAQSGKAIPTASADYWLHLLELVRHRITQ